MAEDKPMPIDGQSPLLALAAALEEYLGVEVLKVNMASRGVF